MRLCGWRGGDLHTDDIFIVEIRRDKFVDLRFGDSELVFQRPTTSLSFRFLSFETPDIFLHIVDFAFQGSNLHTSIA
jgi:hypothetical protein